MRRIAAYVLVALATFALVFAALLRFYAYPRLAVAPADQYGGSRSVAENATYLDSGSLTLRRGQTLVANRTVRADVAGEAQHKKETGEDRGIWDVFLTIDNVKTGALVSAVQDRYAFDRRTQQAVDCCNAGIDGTPVRHEGIEYKFPVGAQKKTYRYFDLTLRRATDMQFKGEEQVKGLHVYRYEQDIAPEQIASLQVPGSVLGLPAPTVQAGRFYANKRTVWVEPVSGVIVRGQEQQHSTLQAQGRSVVITDARLAFDDATVSDAVKRAQDTRSSVRLLFTMLPLGLLVVGLGLLAAAVFLLREAVTTSETAPGGSVQPVGILR